MIQADTITKEIDVLQRLIKENIRSWAKVIQKSEFSIKKGVGIDYEYLKQEKPWQDFLIISKKAEEIDKMVFHIPLFEEILKNLNKLRVNFAYLINSSKTKTISQADIQKCLKEMQIIKKQVTQLRNWDLELYWQLRVSGMDQIAIQRLMSINIKKNTLKYLTDSDVESLGIVKLGDKLILKDMINKPQ